MERIIPPDGSYRSAKPVSLVKRTDKPLGRSSLARLSNSYLKDCAKQVVVLKFLQYVTVACLCLLVVLLMNFSSVNYRVFATSKAGTLTILPPVDQDILESDIVLWVVDAVIHTTTMGFHDHDLRLSRVRNYFTDRGWESYNRFLRSSPGGARGWGATRSGQGSIYHALERERLVMWGAPASPPTIMQRTLLGGVRTYQVRVDLSIRYNWSGKVFLPHRVELTVERVDADVNPHGLAISRWRVVY